MFAAMSNILQRPPYYWQKAARSKFTEQQKKIAAADETFSNLQQQPFLHSEADQKSEPAVKYAN